MLGRIDTGPAPPALAALPAVAPGALPEILAAVAQASGHVAPRVARADLLFVPYWRATAVIAGHVAGRQTRRETCIRREADENGQFGFVQHVAVEEEKDVAREVERVQTVLVSGCPLRSSA